MGIIRQRPLQRLASSHSARITVAARGNYAANIAGDAVGLRDLDQKSRYTARVVARMSVSSSEPSDFSARKSARMMAWLLVMLQRLHIRTPAANVLDLDRSLHGNPQATEVIALALNG